MNGVVKWKWVRWIGYVTHEGGDKCEQFFSENMNMRDNLGELGRVKRIILKVSLNNLGVKVFSWLRMMLIVQNDVMKLKDSFKGTCCPAQ